LQQKFTPSTKSCRQRHRQNLNTAVREAQGPSGTGLLADCAGREELSQRLGSRAAVMEAAAEAVGWQYRVLRPPDPVLAANLGWLAGYRHPRYGGAEPAGRVAEVFQRPRPLIEGVRELGDPAEVLPVVFHALWNGALSAPLDAPLHERVTVTAGRAGRQQA
ncbi:TnsA-like heteromeric transposase endonuclease subunit, partial [Streptomyces sp. NPDC005133]